MKPVALFFGMTLALPGAVFAQGAVEPTVDYTIVSIIGDRFTVADKDTDARREGRKGSQFPLGSASVDGAVLAAVREVLVDRLPGSNVTLAVIREPAVYEAEEEVLGLTRDTQPLLDALQPVLSRIRARRVVLVSKTRDPVGAGALEGVGFYLAGGTNVFANFRVTVIDQATGRTLDEERIAVVEPVVDVRKDPWIGMTPEQKVAALKDVTTTQLRKVLPGLLERSR